MLVQLVGLAGQVFMLGQQVSEKHSTFDNSHKKQLLETSKSGNVEFNQ